MSEVCEPESSETPDDSDEDFAPVRGGAWVFPGEDGIVSETNPTYVYTQLENGSIEISCSTTDTTIEVPAEEIEYFLEVVAAIPGCLASPISELPPDAVVVCLDE